ncbi:MAG: LPD23 domain-containing protein [Candidatus Micrarchaeaceae archaeon]
MDDITDDEFIEAKRLQLMPDADPVIFKQAFLDKYADPVEPPSTLSIGIRGVASGIGHMLRSFGALYDYAASTREPSALTKLGTEILQENAPPPHVAKSLSDDISLLTDIDWWAFNLGSLLPYTLSAFVPGMGGYMLGARVAGAIGASARVAGILGSTIGQTLFDSFAEAGSVYADLIEQGKSIDEAKQGAQNVFASNVVLNAVINSAQVGRLFRNAKGVISEDLVRKTAAQILKDAGVVGAEESIQEMLQQIISNEALGLPWHTGIAESGILGAVSGAGFGGGMDILANATIRSKNKLIGDFNEEERIKREKLIQEEEKKEERVGEVSVKIPEDDVRAKVLAKYENILKTTLSSIDNITSPEELEKITQHLTNSLIQSAKTQSERNLLLSSMSLLQKYVNNDTKAYAKELARYIVEGQAEEEIERELIKQQNAAAPLHLRDAVARSVKYAKKSLTEADRKAIDEVLTQVEDPSAIATNERLRKRISSIIGVELSTDPKLINLPELKSVLSERITRKITTPSDNFPLSDNKRTINVPVPDEQAQPVRQLTVEEFKALPIDEKRRIVMQAYNIPENVYNLIETKLLKRIAQTRSKAFGRKITPEELLYSRLAGVYTEINPVIEDILKQEVSDDVVIREAKEYIGAERFEELVQQASAPGVSGEVTALRVAQRLYREKYNIPEHMPLVAPDAVMTLAMIGDESRAKIVQKRLEEIRSMPAVHVKEPLAVAMQMKEQSVPMDEIFKKTGWYYTDAFGWRFRISSENAKLLEGGIKKLLATKATTLGEILDYPELYFFYPELQKLPVYLVPLLEGRPTLAFTDWKSSRPDIYLTLLGLNKKLVLHEVTHAIQKIARQSLNRGNIINIPPGLQQYRGEFERIADKVAEGFDFSAKSLDDFLRIITLPGVSKWLQFVLNGHARYVREVFKTAMLIQSSNEAKDTFNNIRNIIKSYEASPAEVETVLKAYQWINGFEHPEHILSLLSRHHELDSAISAYTTQLEFYNKFIPALSSNNAKEIVDVLNQYDYNTVNGYLKWIFSYFLTPIEIEARESAHNFTGQFGEFYASVPTPGDVSGAISFLNDGTYLLYALKNADARTFLHEVIGHMLVMYYLTPVELTALEKYLNKKREGWNRQDYERIAYEFDKWIATKQAPNSVIEAWFKKIRDFLVSLYRDVKAYFGDISINPDLEKVFNSWIDEKAQESLERQIREQVLGDDVLTDRRIIGSIEDVPLEEVAAKQEQLLAIGYKSTVIPLSDGTHEIIYYIEPTEKVQDAIALRTRELLNNDLTIIEKKRLGRAFGYSEDSIREYIDQLKVESLKERYHIGGEYYAVKTPFKRGTDYYEVVSRDSEKKTVTLRLIEGSSLKELGLERPELTMTEEQFAQFKKRRVEKVLRGGKLPSGKAVAKLNETQQVDDTKDDVEALMNELDVTEGELQDFLDITELRRQEEAKGAEVNPYEGKIEPHGVNVQFNTELKTEALLTGLANLIKDFSAEPSEIIARVLLTESELKKLHSYKKPTYAHLYQILSDRLSSTKSFPNPTGIIKKVLPGLDAAQREDLYNELGLSAEDGAKLSDDALTKMIWNKLTQFDGGFTLAHIITKNTDSILHEVESEGKSIYDRLTLDEIKGLLKDADIDAEGRKALLTKAYQLLGMSQSLAAYNYRMFGRIFWSVDKGLKLASNLLFSHLGIQTSQYLRIKRMPVEQLKKVVRALIDGTTYSDNSTKPIEPEAIDLDTIKKLYPDDIYQQMRKEYQEKLREYRRALAQWKRNRGKEWTNEELRSRYDMNNDEIAAYRYIRTIANNTTHYWKLSSIMEGMPNEMADAIFSLPGYVPLDHGTGKFAFIYKHEESPTGYGFARFKTYRDAKRAWEALNKEGLVVGGDPQYDIYRIDEIPAEHYRHFSVGTLSELLEEAGIPKEQKDKVLKQFKKLTYANSRTIPRGYAGLILDVDNFFSVFETWVEKTAKRYGRALVRTEIDSIVIENRRESKHDRIARLWRQFAHDYINTSFAPREGHEFWEGMRRFGFLYALAGNVGNLILNLTQVPLLLPGVYAQPIFNLSTGEINKILFDSFTRAMKYAFNRELVLKDYPKLGDAIEYWAKTGTTSPSTFERLIGIEGGESKWLRVAGIMQTSSEQLNRLVSSMSGYMATYDYLLKRAVGNADLSNLIADMIAGNEIFLQKIALELPDAERVDTYIEHRQKIFQKVFSGDVDDNLAHDIATALGARISDLVNFVYGRHGLPEIIRKAGILSEPLRASFLFKGFMLNYLGFILTQLKTGSPKTIAYTLVPLLLLAGLNGFPFAEDLKDVLRQMGITDVDTEFKKLLRNATLSDFISKGVTSVLPGKLAFDISRRAGIGTIINPRAGLYETIGALLAGAPGEFLVRVADGLNDIVSGDTTIGYRKIMPMMIRYFMNSVRYGEEGAITMGGKMLVPPEELRGMPQVIAAIGFKPKAVSDAEELVRALNFIKTKREDAIEKFNFAIANAVRKNDAEELREILEEIAEYNSKVPPYERYNYREQLRNIRRRYREGVNPRYRILKAPKAVRKEAMELEELYERR